MLNNEYARAAKKSNGYIYVSPTTRAAMTTKEGAPLLSEYEWKEIETYLATSFWSNRLYNPTPYKADPNVMPYRRFFEHTIRSRLILKLDEYRRIYDALNISFLPADRTFQMIDDATASDGTHDTTEETTRTGSDDLSRDVSGESENVKTGAEIDSGMNDRFTEETGERSDTVTEGGTRQNVTDTGTPSGASGVQSGQVSTEKQQYTGFNASTPHDNTQTVRSVDPARTVETESFTGRTTTHKFTTGDAQGDNVPTTFEQGATDNTHTYDDVTDTGTTSQSESVQRTTGEDGTRTASDVTTNEGETHRTVTGWGGYDIEASVAANIEIAKTCIADMIADEIRSAVILTDSVPYRTGDTDFLCERRTWGSVSDTRWGSWEDDEWKEMEEDL